MKFALLKIIDDDVAGWIIAESWTDLRDRLLAAQIDDPDIKDLALPEDIPDAAKTRLTKNIILLCQAF